MRLFNPRIDLWEDHFHWSGLALVSNTPIGRATIAVMNMNDPRRMELRRIIAGIAKQQ